jgi:hypothetical protein
VGTGAEGPAVRPPGAARTQHIFSSTGTGAARGASQAGQTDKEERRFVMTRKTLMCGIGLLVLVGGLALQAEAQYYCGCMDVVLVIDDTGSMFGAIENVKAGLGDIVAAADTASGGDLQMGLVSFKDDVEADWPLTFTITDVENAINALSAGGGANLPEASDEALNYVVNGGTACTLFEPEGPLGAFRGDCVKIAVLVTDALPGGCDDAYTPGVDDVNANAVADDAAAAGILISAVYVPTSSTPADLEGIMMYYADTTGGVYTEVASNGDGTGAAIEEIIEACGTPGIPFAWDLKFCSLPNAFNCNRTKGVVPAVIFGTPELDVATIDLSTVELALASDPSTGIPLVNSSIMDVGSPGDVDIQECMDDYGNADGIMDLELKFDAAAVAGLIGCPLEFKEGIELVLTGIDMWGTELEAVNTQIIWNIGKNKAE